MPHNVSAPPDTMSQSSINTTGACLMTTNQPAHSRKGVGYPALMGSAVQSVADLPDGFIALGFSNGGGMSEYVATQRNVGGVVMLSGALGLEELGVDSWPEGVPAQIHYTVDDPFRNQGWIDSVIHSVRESGGAVDVFDYPGAGHLFTDESLADEFDATNTELLWARVVDFCSRV